MENKEEKTLNEKECECWNIEGYGINGICLYCYWKRVEKLKKEFKSRKHHYVNESFPIEAINLFIDKIFGDFGK